MTEMREPSANQSWLEVEGVKPDYFLTFTGKLTEEKAAVFRKRFEEARLRPTSLLGDGGSHPPLSVVEPGVALAAGRVVMVDVGPLLPVLCPNGQTCPHDIVQHRYEPDRERWVCTVGNCHENPYRVIKVREPLSASMLNAENAARYWSQLRAAHPEATFEFVEYPKIGVEESRRTRRRRLGLRWWQRESAHYRDEDLARTAEWERDKAGSLDEWRSWFGSSLRGGPTK